MRKHNIFDRKTYENRTDLVGEHRLGDMGQLILLVIFLAVWIVDSFFLRFSTFWASHVTLFIRVPIAAIVLILAAILAQNGMSVVFGEIRQNASIIHKGVFRIVRHPIYLGAILLYLGLIVLTLSLASVMIWMIIVGFYHAIARHEEKLLIEQFGIEYEKYMAQVPMWIPRL